MTISDKQGRNVVLTKNNAARAQAAAATEAAWIADLGDLSTYRLSERLQQAAELRRDHPDLSYTQLAGKMGITKHAFTGLIRRFRVEIKRQRTPAYRGPVLTESSLARSRAIAANDATWIAELGDLSRFDLPTQVRQAAELQRDHPELTRTQLANKMGIRRGQYAQLIYRFRALVHRPPVSQWITDLGDLSAFPLSPRDRQAAELRRDHPELTRDQLAAKMNITVGAYSYLIARVRSVVSAQSLHAGSPIPMVPRLDTQITGAEVADLGDLSAYPMSPRARRAAELRRDHPELTRDQLAAKMNITVGAYSTLLHRVQVAAGRAQPWVQRITDLGDLSAYPVTPRVRQAAELRRDHPELTRVELAAKMNITPAAYEHLLYRLRATVFLANRPAEAGASTPRVGTASAIDSARIAELGDLSVCPLSPRVRRAAELRRDHPELTHTQLAAMMGITADAYRSLLDRFWMRGPGTMRPAVAAAGIAQLGDLSRYSVSQNVRRAAELRRDHPELTLAELAAKMGVSRDGYQARLARFRAAVRGDLEAARRPVPPEHFVDPRQAVRTVEATRHLCAG
ncbi:helix-turn-helix domain-containing protein [Mycobacteroides abscessus]|uniref:helix-turn-helix domain-containing protein n=1 Tax=Mycobacteroides abscessus TaxID=36809 RepID=UPI000C25A055|nr:helix-turn-helix domain-containing protein [Mycobacteroides abscessus]